MTDDKKDPFDPDADPDAMPTDLAAYRLAQTLIASGVAPAIIAPAFIFCGYRLWLEHSDRSMYLRLLLNHKETINKLIEAETPHHLPKPTKELKR